MGNQRNVKPFMELSNLWPGRDLPCEVFQLADKKSEHPPTCTAISALRSKLNEQLLTHTHGACLTSPEQPAEASHLQKEKSLPWATARWLLLSAGSSWTEVRMLFCDPARSPLLLRRQQVCETEWTREVTRRVKGSLSKGGGGGLGMSCREEHELDGFWMRSGG